MRLISQSDDMLTFESVLPLAFFALAIISYYCWTIYDMGRDGEPSHGTVRIKQNLNADDAPDNEEDPALCGLADIGSLRSVHHWCNWDFRLQIIIISDPNGYRASPHSQCPDLLLRNPLPVLIDLEDHSDETVVRRRV